MKERTKALILLAMTAVMWSIAGLLIKSIDTNPMAIAGARSAIASVVLLAKLKKPKITFSFAQIGAAISYTATVLLFVSANKMTTAANAILLQFTAPAYIALLGWWILKEKTKVTDWITIFIVLGGMVLFFLDNLSLKGMYGNIIAAASGLSFALFNMFMRMQKEGSPLESVFIGNIITAVIGIPFIFKSVPGTRDWVLLLVLGVVQLGIPYILYSKAITHVNALEAVLILVIEPLLNPIWVLLLMGEVPGLLSLIGGLIVLAAVTLRSIFTAVSKEGRT